MRGLSYVLLVVGVIIAIVGLVNHFVLHKNPVAHTSTIAIAIGAVLAVIAVVMMMGGRSAKAG
jgi:ABC-type cobalamin transport system permease subunit